MTYARHEPVMIVGHGIAGPALALFLHRAGVGCEIHEARTALDAKEGLFLFVAPNGMHVLGELGLADAVRAEAIEPTGIEFLNGKGRRIGVIDGHHDASRDGAAGCVIRRSRLHRILHDAVERHDVPVHMGSRVAAVDERDDVVEVTFADGSTRTTGILVGADGIHSRTRRIALPSAPEPSYLGLLDCGGVVRLPRFRHLEGPQHMIFGRRAFFSYTVHPSGDIYWFSNVPEGEEPTRAAIERTAGRSWHARLRELHAGDPDPVGEILAHMPPDDVSIWPLRDLPNLPTWHSRRICLVGDAAHAMSPSAGQGASMALESSLVLAKCLRDTPDRRAAFARYEAIRRPRVERVVAQARRNGSTKIPHPIAGVFRDLLLPVFLRMGARDAQRTYGHRVSWGGAEAP